MANFLETVQNLAENGYDLIEFLFDENVMQIVPHVGTALTDEPTLVELYAYLYPLEKVIDRLFAQTIQPITILEPFFVVFQVSLHRRLGMFIF